MTGFHTLLDPRVARHLASTLRALRHLHPPTRPRRLLVPYLRALADDLLRLPDEVDPVRWLRDERGEDVARRRDLGRSAWLWCHEALPLRWQYLPHLDDDGAIASALSRVPRPA
jgi:hypothetical protein